MANILTSKIQVPSLPDDTLILKDAEARNDLSTALATVTGNPLNFSTRSSQKAKETVISLEPIQDLHGYDYPWPAGGGKNKLPMTVDGIKAGNTSGTWSGNVYTINNGTCTIKTDDDGNVTGIIINGTFSQNTTFILGNVAGFNSETIISGCPNGGGYNKYRIRFDTDGYNDDGAGIAVPSNTQMNNIRIVYYSANGTASNLLFQPMIRLATETDATFASYSNYCPIDGRTETSLVGCGVNEFNIFEFAKDYQTVGTSKVGRLLLYLKGNTKYTISTNIPLVGEYHSASVFAWIGGISAESPNTSQNGVSNGISRTITTFSGGALTIGLYIDETTSGNATYEDVLDGTYYIKVEEGSQATPYVESNRITIQFGEKVYGVTVELEKGTVTVDTAIADLGDLTWTYNSTALRFDAASLPTDSVVYSRTTLPDAICTIYKGVIWDGNGTNPSGADKAFMFDSRHLIIRDTAYTDATAFKTAVTGQKLCYKIITPRTITLTPNEISLLSGVNNISTDGDSIKLIYRDGKVATLADLQNTANNLQEQIDQNETIKDETTQLLYKLGVNNGLLFMEEV